MSQVIWFLSWLVALELMGLAALPIALRLLRPLPDRGFIFAKPLGVLLVGYLSWLLGVFGALRFEQSTIAVLLLGLGVVCWAAWGRDALRELSTRRPVIWASETLFLLCFAAASLIRAYNPEIAGTEKPMDFAFLNALYRTDVLPPEDPWMSGYSVSYYYFGYLLLAAVAKLSGVPAAVGYNLGVSVVFSLLLAGCFSLGFNLISMLQPQTRLTSRLAPALLAPLMVGLMGNLEIGLEMLALRGVGGASFWQWVGIKGLQASPQPEGWFPVSHWWWWRASRVIPTIKPDGIDEFPYFSFLLGDLHPHYTALPWALLAIAICLAALVAARESLAGLGTPRISLEEARPPRDSAEDYPGPPPAGASDGPIPTPEKWHGRARHDWLGLIVPALSLGFLLVGNSWDFPTYTGLFWLASLTGVVRGPRPDRLPSPTLKRLALTSALSVLLYSPFFLGFSSQTKGIGLAADKTPLPSMLIIFGPFLFVLASLLVWRLLSEPSTNEVVRAGRRSLALLGAAAALCLLSWFVGAFAVVLALLLLAGSIALRHYHHVEKPATPQSAAQRFLLLLVLLGLLLVFVPEFVFLVDLFGTRMNTVFKFHYQAWLMLGIASSAAAVWLVGSMRSRWPRVLVAAGAALLVGVGLLYPLMATPAKAQGFAVRPTLDGAAFFQPTRPDDYAAIQWLSRTVLGRPVVLEAVGGEYSEYARVSTFSGLPTVLGWAGHEVQWRGQGEEPQRRARDVEAIYRTADRSAVLELLKRYRVGYVFVGSLEVERYGPEVTSRFEGLLEPVYRQGRVTIYRVP